MGKTILKATMDKPEIDDVLKCSTNLHKKEIKLGEDKIYFGCYCKIEVLYKGKDSVRNTIIRMMYIYQRSRNL